MTFKGNVEWLSWKPADVFLSAKKFGREPLPVYVQSHALRQIRTRLDLPSAVPYLDAWMADSLKTPKVVERRGKDLLVEQRLNDQRMGYLWVTPTPTMFVVRTFLFLTMAPSPEFRQLERRLKLSRRDADYLGLTRLSSFLDTDLRQDERLCELFAACGCGHLLGLDEEHYAAEPKPLAAEVQHYLRLAA